MTSASVECLPGQTAGRQAASLASAAARGAGGRARGSVRTRAGIIRINPHAIAAALIRRRPDLILSASPARTGRKRRG